MSPLRPRFRRARHGFTLVELMVSLVMGLIIALAAVGLARTATNTFHEQARLSVTEMGVRSAAERLRQDLMRVSYMSTGNIALDPKLARRADWETAAQRARYSELLDLQGIRVFVGASKAATEGPGTLATNNGLNPDAIEITGNLTTDDAYSGTIATGGRCPSGQVVYLDPRSDAAVYSLVGGLAGTDAGAGVPPFALHAFLPDPNRTFAVRVTDPMGCHHYAPVCNVTYDGSLLAIHLVGDGRRAVLYSHSASGEYENPPGLVSNCGASEGGRVTISPVARVRWQLSASPAVLDPGGVEPAGSKFDLTRQLLDIEGEPVGAPEIVAEYAVDLKFGLTVWDPARASMNTPQIEVLDFDDARISQVTARASTTVAGLMGPQHVRSVRYRIATRAAIADRGVDLPVGPGRPYMARYCVDGQPLATCQRFARVRTLMSEVTLQNQARMFY